MDEPFGNVSLTTMTERIEVQLVFGLTYLSVFLVGLSGNVLVCFVVIRNPQMRKSVTNLFIGNLAVSNALLCLLAVPFTPLYTFMGYWAFGALGCKILAFSLPVNVYVSSWTLTAIAVDRYLVIIYPFRQRMKTTVCLFIIVTIWMVTLLMSFPYYLYREIENEQANTTLCEENWPSEPFRQIFNSSTVVFQFLVPFIIMAFCYIKVSQKLSDRPRPGSRTSSDEERSRKRTKRTIKMLISMVLVFLVLWLPLYAVNFIDDLHSTANSWPYFNLVFLVAHCIAMTSSCCNPFLYAWHNENFREEFKLVLPCFSTSTSVGAAQNIEGSKRLCNGRDTVQETLLPTLSSKQISSNCEIISLKQTTNLSRPQVINSTEVDGWSSMISV